MCKSWFGNPKYFPEVQFFVCSCIGRPIGFHTALGEFEAKTLDLHGSHPAAEELQHIVRHAAVVTGSYISMITTIIKFNSIKKVAIPYHTSHCKHFSMFHDKTL